MHTIYYTVYEDYWRFKVCDILDVDSRGQSHVPNVNAAYPHLRKQINPHINIVELDLKSFNDKLFG